MSHGLTTCDGSGMTGRRITTPDHLRGSGLDGIARIVGRDLSQRNRRHLYGHAHTAGLYEHADRFGDSVSSWQQVRMRGHHIRHR